MGLVAYNHPIGRKNTAYIPGIVLVFVWWLIWPNGIIFHQPRFPWNNGISLNQKATFWGVNRDPCDVAIIWPEVYTAFVLRVPYNPYHLSPITVRIIHWQRWIPGDGSMENAALFAQEGTEMSWNVIEMLWDVIDMSWNGFGTGFRISIFFMCQFMVPMVWPSTCDPKNQILWSCLFEKKWVFQVLQWNTFEINKVFEYYSCCFMNDLAGPVDN